MFTVHLLRKSPSTKGVLEGVRRHAVGVLNIDGSRIGSNDVLSRRNQSRSNELVYNGGGWKTGVFGTGDTNGGRWPANLIVVHRGCRVAGTQEVITGKAIREKSGGNTVFSDRVKPALPNLTYGNEEGRERIVKWDCVEECPGCLGTVLRFFKQVRGARR